MKCKYCNGDMELVYSMDSCSSGTDDGHDICYNIYECEDCMSIMREDIWGFKGQRWISPQNE